MTVFDFNEIPAEGERWLQFARDFMQHLGFHIETPSYRDAENVFDFCAVEHVPGKFNLLPFRWLVSCRHKASMRTSVKESEEANVLERVLRCRADGFIGFYSSQVSPALEYRLSELKAGAQIRDYRFFDAKVLAGYLSTPEFGRIVSRYFPNHAKTHGVLHLVAEEYLPICCENCNTDLLQALFAEDRKGVLVSLRRQKKSVDEMEVVADMYTACKGACDEELQSKYCRGTTLNAAGWVDLSDLVKPSFFLERLITMIDQIGNDEVTFSAAALEKEKYLIRALAQYVLRESGDGEKRPRKVQFNG